MNCVTGCRFADASSNFYEDVCANQEKTFIDQQNSRRQATSCGKFSLLQPEAAAGTSNLDLVHSSGSYPPPSPHHMLIQMSGLQKLSQASSRTGALEGVTRMGIVPMRAPLQSRAFLALSYLANSRKAMLVER